MHMRLSLSYTAVSSMQSETEAAGGAAARGSGGLSVTDELESRQRTAGLTLSLCKPCAEGGPCRLAGATLRFPTDHHILFISREAAESAGPSESPLRVGS